MAEKEYIERGLILGTMATYFGKADDREEQATIDIWNGIKKIPAADVVEVVRCKDCRHAKMQIDIIGDPHLFCGLATNRVEMEFDDFCSYCERKEQE